MVVLIVFTASAAQAAPGDLDPTFGAGGKVIVDAPDNDSSDAAAMALQPDGKVIAVGWVWPDDDFVIVRLNPDGSLDPSFGIDGVATVDFGINDFASAVAIQDDGKIVVAGKTSDTSTGSTNGNFAVARLDSDGSPDLTFGGDGQTTVDLGAEEDADDLLIQDDGKIIIAGSRQVTSCPCEASFAVVRLNSDGSLDTSFDGDGSTSIPFAGFSYALASSVDIQTDDKIVVAGWVEDDVEPDTGGAMARLNPDGSLDASFGTGGTEVIDDLFVLGVEDLAVLPDGGIAAVGETLSGGNFNFAVAGLNSDGSLDGGFGSAGLAQIDFGGQDGADGATAVTFQPDGKLVVAGWTFDGLEGDFAIARLTSNGLLDATFAGDGRATVDFDGDDSAQATAVQADDAVVVVGNTFDGDTNPTSQMAVARLEGGEGVPDRDPPTTAITGGPAEGSTIASSSVQLAFSAGETGATFECSLDGAAFVACASPKSYAGLANGPHTFRVRASHQTTGQGPVATRSFTVNVVSTPPRNPSPPSGSPPASSAPSPAPRPKPAIAFFARAGQVKGNKALIRTRCVGDSACRGVAKLIARVKTKGGKRGGKKQAARRTRNVVIGKSRFNLAPGRRGVLRIRLTRAGRKLVKRSGRRGLRARLVGRGLQNRAIKLRPQNGKKNKGKKRSGRGGRSKTR